MSYKDIIIYSMSGTGNSLRAAIWMRDEALKRGAAARVVPVEKANNSKEAKAVSVSLLGLVMPTHGFIAPWHMIKFAMGLPRSKNCHAFVTLTRAGIKIGPVFVPGLEGTGAYLIALILLLKGYSVRGVMGLDMPSNWMSLHWGLNLENSRAIIGRNRTRALWFINRILTGGHFYGGIIPLLLGLILLPVSFLYLLAGRFFLAKIFFATDRCTGCGLCVENCLTGSLKISGKKKRRPYWTFSCESCMRCMAFCPAGAVEASHSFGVILYFLTTIPVADYLLNRLAGMLPGLSCVYNDWTVALVQYPFILLSIFLTYLLFTALLRITLFNRLFTYTTLTHIYRRYHEPETRLKDFRC